MLLDVALFHDFSPSRLYFLLFLSVILSLLLFLGFVTARFVSRNALSRRHFN